MKKIYFTKRDFDYRKQLLSLSILTQVKKIL